jgi:hypothetical protein
VTLLLLLLCLPAPLQFIKGDIQSMDLLSFVLLTEQIDTVMHFAAQVRGRLHAQELGGAAATACLWSVGAQPWRLQLQSRAGWHRHALCGTGARATQSCSSTCTCTCTAELQQHLHGSSPACLSVARSHFTGHVIRGTGAGVRPQIVAAHCQWDAGTKAATVCTAAAGVQLLVDAAAEQSRSTALWTQSCMCSCMCRACMAANSSSSSSSAVFNTLASTQVPLLCRVCHAGAAAAAAAAAIQTHMDNSFGNSRAVYQITVA